MSKDNKTRPGEKFGRWLILELSEIRTYLRQNNKTQKEKFWKCQCECGKIKIVCDSSLRSGTSKSCGCLSKEVSKLKTLTNNLSAKNKLFGVYKRQAEKRGYIFELLFNKFVELTLGNCYYCGISPSQIMQLTKNGIPYLYNGIDRKNNEIGYTEENCVSCCGKCNVAKMSMSEDIFLDLIERIYNNRIKNG